MYQFNGLHIYANCFGFFFSEVSYFIFAPKIFLFVLETELF